MSDLEDPRPEVEGVGSYRMLCDLFDNSGHLQLDEHRGEMLTGLSEQSEHLQLDDKDEKRYNSSSTEDTANLQETGNFHNFRDFLLKSNYSSEKSQLEATFIYILLSSAILNFELPLELKGRKESYRSGRSGPRQLFSLLNTHSITSFEVHSTAKIPSSLRMPCCRYTMFRRSYATRC